MHPLYKIVLADLRIDAQQMLEEGHDLAALNSEIEVAAATGSLDVLAKLQEDLWHRPSPASFPYGEPNDWESISHAFPDPEIHARFHGNEATLADRLLAAWQGRCVGCQLGKPLEGCWPEELQELCVRAGSWPLYDYINAIANPDDQASLKAKGYRVIDGQNNLTRGRFTSVAPDDDVHYAIAGQRTLQQHGIDFTPDQAIATISKITPQGILFAAGLNMVRKAGIGVPAPLTAVFGNSWGRQSLGAQIRCDPYGWAAPANPPLAARMAYRDACGSQTRNGIYTGIFFAVAMADAIGQGDPIAALATAEHYVPPRSRFAEMIQFTRQACREHDDWQAVNAALYARYDQDAYAPKKAPMNHSLINAAITIMAILKGRGDFTQTLGISVMAGRDTDCNGATAGSIMGCALGTAGIPRHWVDPLHDTVRTELLEQHVLKISDLALEMFAIARTNCRYTSAHP